MIFWIPLTDLGKKVLTVTLASKVEPQLSKVSSIYLKAMNKEVFIFQMTERNYFEDFHVKATVNNSARDKEEYLYEREI